MTEKESELLALMKQMRSHLHRLADELESVIFEHESVAKKPPASVPEKPTFDFDAVYASYPRKVGKSLGIKKCKSQIKTKMDYEALFLAIKRFKEYHRTRGTLPEYIPHFSTFMTSWSDWLEEGHGGIDLSGMRKTETTAEYLARERKRAEEEEKLNESRPGKDEIEKFMHQVRSNMRP